MAQEMSLQKQNFLKLSKIYIKPKELKIYTINLLISE